MADKDDYPIADRDKDPRLNDKSQPSVTTAEEALQKANENAGAGVGKNPVGIPAPADAIDLAYRTELADVDAVEVGKKVAKAQKAGVDAEDIDVEGMGEGSPKTTKSANKAKAGKE